MAIDTKPNLSNDKFEQQIGDVLDLSGVTKIYNSIIFENGATFIFKNNAGVGKVLTSDDFGVITLQDNIGSVIDCFNNGLTLSNGRVSLGGTLTGDTYINGNYSLNFSNQTYLNSDSGYGISGETILRTSLKSINAIFIGSNAGNDNINDDSIGIGNSTLKNTTSVGYNNVAIGNQVLFNNIDGNTNIGIGNFALYNNNNGIGNIAIGCRALYFNICGKFNTAINHNALFCNETGCRNVAIGNSALCLNKTGNNNIALGHLSMSCISGGSDNISIGSNGLRRKFSGNCNIGLGSNALFCNISGDSNIGIGVNSGYLNINGSGNVFIGTCAGYNETGSNKLHIGNNPNKSLIYGEFDNDKLCIRGSLYVSGLTNSSANHIVYYNTTTHELSYFDHTHPYVGLSGDEVVNGVKTFTSFPITPSSYPTEDYEVANKKYVDSGLNDVISENFPIGLRGNVYYINNNNTNTTEADYIVKKGLIVQTDAELIQAQGAIVTFEEIFNTWYMFAHASWHSTYLNSTYINKTVTRTATSVTGSGTTATVKLMRHGFRTGNIVTISGASPSMYNGTFTITVVDMDTFRYTTSSSTTSSPATGTISVSHTITNYQDCPIQTPRHFPASDPLNTYYPFTIDDILENNGIWGYDSVNDRIYCYANFNAATGFISMKLYNRYELTVDISSSDSDNDANGVVIAFVTDPETGFEYTLSAVRFYDLVSSIYTYAIVYNFRQNMNSNDTYDATYADSSEVVLVDGSSLVSTSGSGWNSAGGTRMYVKREDDIISVKISNQGSTIINENTLLTYDLKSNEKTRRFRGPARFGFMSASQANSFFNNLKFSGFDNYIFYDRGTYTDTYEYNESLSTWNLQSPQTVTPKEYFGVGRIVNSYLFGRLYFIEYGGTLSKLTVTSGSSNTHSITGATNLGSGNGSIFSGILNQNIQLKTLSGGTNITITSDDNYIKISSTGGNVGIPIVDLGTKSSSFDIDLSENKLYIVTLTDTGSIINVNLLNLISNYSNVNVVKMYATNNVNLSWNSDINWHMGDVLDIINANYTYILNILTLGNQMNNVYIQYSRYLTA